MFKAIVQAWVQYEKDKKKKNPVQDWEYQDLSRQEVLYSSDYLGLLAKKANTKDKRDAIHEYMNKFREGQEDIYDIESYRKISDYLITKERIKW